jgi:hypothetical protein
MAEDGGNVADDVRTWDSETIDQAAQSGLALLRLLAEASAPTSHAQGWVNRRVQQLEFLDTRAVQWRVSVDFNVPADAPIITVGGKDFRLISVMPWEKADLVAFDLRGESGNVMWLPNSERINHQLSAALAQWAQVILNGSAARPATLDPLPAGLGAILDRIVWCRPPEWLKEGNPFGGISALPDPGAGSRPLTNGAADGVELREAIERLKCDTAFMGQLQELWQNFLIVAAVADPPGTRRVIKLAFESEVTFRSPRGWGHKLLQSLGLRTWRLDLLIGGRGGSHHLEVAAPAGVDIVRISAKPVRSEQAGGKFTARGGTPHVHIQIPGRQHGRYLATIRLRVSRPGWLTTSWMAGLVIFVTMLLGRIKLDVLYAGSPGAVPGAEAGTAATLLLALLAVFGTILFGPGGHPLASRLLRLARFLILADSAAVLCGAGSLLLHVTSSSAAVRAANASNPLLHPPPGALCTVLAWVAGIVEAMLTLSLLFPRGPQPGERRRGGIPRRITEMTASARTRVNEWRARIPGLKPTDAIVTIPAADGYSYADNNDWEADDYGRLAGQLKDAESPIRA